ncbi:MAG: CHAT domain-containing protein [Alphaproteobacteria bacterium]|nr:CHAT domain-containing protein [Alphaproteobacteria bacterium]
MIVLLLAWLVAPAAAVDRDRVRGEVIELRQQRGRLYESSELERSLEVAREAVARADDDLPRRDALRLWTHMDLGDALYAVNRFPEALAQYQLVYDAIRKIRTEQEIELVSVAASNLGATYEQLGQLDKAMASHQEAWSILLHYQAYFPSRFQVGSQYADTCEATGAWNDARMLREWLVTATAQEHGADGIPVAYAEVGLAQFLVALRDLEGAEQHFRNALAIWDARDPEAADAAATRLLLGRLLLDGLRLEEARALIEPGAAFLVQRFGEDSPRGLDALDALAVLAWSDSRLEESLALRRRVFAGLVERLGESHQAIVGSRLELASSLMELGQLEEAEVEARAALALLQQLHGDDHESVARSLGQLGFILVQLGRPQEAVEALEGSLDPYLDRPDAALWVPGQLALIGHAKHEASDFDGAREALQEALRRAIEVYGPDHLEVAEIRNVYGAFLAEVGPPEEAEAQLRLSLATWEREAGPHSPVLSGVLNNLAYVLEHRGDIIEAQALFERTIADVEQALGPDSPDLAPMRHNLAQLLLARGDFPAARRELDRSLAIRTAVYGEKHPNVAISLGAQAQLAHIEGRMEDADRLSARALALREEVQSADHVDLAYSLAARASILSALARYDEAEALLQRADSIVVQLGPRSPQQRMVDAGLAKVRAARGDLEGSLAMWRKTLEALDDAEPDAPERLEVERELAVVGFLLGDVEGGRAEMRRILDVDMASVTTLLGTLSDRERFALIRSHRTAVYRFLQMHEQRGDPRAAYEAVLQYKGIVARSLAVEQPATLSRVDADAYARWRDLRGRLATAMLAGTEGSADEVAKLTAEKEAVRRQLAAASAGSRGPMAETSVDAVCASLPEGTALVDYVARMAERPGETQSRLERLYTAFVVHPGCAIERVELGPAEAIDTAVAKHRELLASRATTARIDKQGARVRAQVWDPVAAAVGDAEQVLVVPDGALATLAFGALPGAGGYLLEKRSFRMLDAALDARPRAVTADRGAVVVGGVDYGPVASAAGTTRAACVSDFPALPATDGEREAVAGLLAGHGAVRRMAGADATEAALTDAIGDASLLHLATHGFFATGECRSSLDRAAGAELVGMNPMLLSGVALADANRDPSAIWTAEEIATLPLDGVDLVVLSACETGLGEIQSGEGVLGLRRAFALSGARATVMSLWPVDDAATRDLMAGFYTHLLADPARDEAAALRAAQRELLAANLKAFGEARPETWAAFVVSGAPRANP